MPPPAIVPAALFTLLLGCPAASASSSSDVSACRLPNKQSRGDVALGFPRIKNRMRATGLLNVSVLFVDFPDAPAERTPAQSLAILAPASAWYAQVSYGAMRLHFSPLLETLRMPLNASAYSFRTVGSQRHYLAEATALADRKHAWDFSSSDSVVVLATPLARALPNGPAFCATPGQGYVASGKTFENSVTSGADFDYWLHKWLNHEMGHTMALVDLYSYSGGPEFGFTGDWSIMGNIAGAGGAFFGWERFLLGWMPEARVACVDEAGSTVLRLAALNDAALGDAPRLVVVKVAATVAVCLEFRAATGLDANISQPGVLAYVVDTSVQSGHGPLRVLPLNSSDASMMSSTLARPGAAIEHLGVRVQLVGFEGGEAVVNVSSPGVWHPSASPHPAPPAASSASLASAWSYIGGGLAGGLVLIAGLLFVAMRLGLWSAGGSGGGGGGGGGEEEDEDVGGPPLLGGGSRGVEEEEEHGGGGGGGGGSYASL